MRVSTKTVLLIATGEVLHRESFEYSGPVAEAIGGTGSATKSKQKQQTSQQGTQESTPKYDENFINKALAFASLAPGKQTTQGSFNAEKYLADNPGLMAQGYPLQPQFAEKHYLETGKAAGLKGEYAQGPEVDIPGYSPSYVRSDFTPGSYTGGAYTPGKFTSMAPEGYGRLEENLYGTQRSKLATAYNEQIARQREELAQSGALNSPAQYLEGGARSVIDKGYLNATQQAARDAALGRLGLEEREAARRTGYDVGEAGARTAYDVGQAGARTAYDVAEAGRRTGYGQTEAERETGFNERVQRTLMEDFLKKIALAITASGRSVSTTGNAQGTSSGSGSQVGGGLSLSFDDIFSGFGGSGGDDPSGGLDLFT